MTPATAETVSAVGTRKNTDLVTEGPAGPEVRYSNGGPAAVPAAGANGHSDRQQGGEEKEMLDDFDEVVGAGIETAPAGRGGAQHTVAFADDEAPKSGARSGLPVAPNAGTSADDQEGDQYARQVSIERTGEKPRVFASYLFVLQCLHTGTGCFVRACLLLYISVRPDSAVCSFNTTFHLNIV